MAQRDNGQPPRANGNEKATTFPAYAIVLKVVFSQNSDIEDVSMKEVTNIKKLLAYRPDNGQERWQYCGSMEMGIFQRSCSRSPETRLMIMYKVSSSSLTALAKYLTQRYTY